jgi:hypothetical protein
MKYCTNGENVVRYNPVTDKTFMYYEGKDYWYMTLGDFSAFLNIDYIEIDKKYVRLMML